MFKYNGWMNPLPHSHKGVVGLSPMAGITDRPFRQLCRRWGASFAVAEMLTSDARLWHTRKSRQRLDFEGEDAPRIVQIAGSEPARMADAARRCEKLGADVIDINMGCPAKKVCKRAAGSALLADETLVAQLIEATVSAVNIPVTLKYRTGTTRSSNNAVRIAHIAEQLGVRALALHGRSREDAYKGQAEHETVRQVRHAVGIPVLANGDIRSASMAKQVLAETGVHGLLIGRGAQGRPWLFAQIRALLDHNRFLSEPGLDEQVEIIDEHVSAIHEFYGADAGVRIARKHIGWYLESWPDGTSLRRQLMPINCAELQRTQLKQGLTRLCIAQAA